MQVAGVARRASRVLRASLFSHSSRCVFYNGKPSPSWSSPTQSRDFSTFSVQNSALSGCFTNERTPKCCIVLRASFSSAAGVSSGNSADTVKEVYDKMLESIKVKRSAPPNAWLWSLIEKCKSQDDVKLLFDILQKLRVFRLSNLRIHDNFNCHLCQEVTKACIRAGAMDFGKKALWKHNVYGLTPTVGSANQLLSYARMQKDTKLMVVLMRLIKQNDLPLQPATADIVFGICYDADKWGLISKYCKRFLKAGVKLRKTTFDIWMEFASKRGDVESLWKIEKLRSETYEQHSIKSAFSCAKAFLLERNPGSAATVIHAANQTFPASKGQYIVAELQKLVSEWPLEVVMHQKREDKKTLIASLKADIPAMISSLANLGVELIVNLEDLNKADLLPC